jgi:glycosyltransferase involved in cell wall biosynthesis
MTILLIEPFFSGSHKTWAEGYQKHSQHDVRLLTLKGRHWKWRMYGGAVSLAKMFMESDLKPDLILATDMLDLTTFLALTRTRTASIPTAVYFHENQLTYPWSPTDEDVKLKRDNQYAFLNYTTALTADAVFFNSAYHKNSFLEALPEFLNQFPDRKELQNIDEIYSKSSVLYLGMDLKRFDKYNVHYSDNEPIILWNHRWEYDKNPNLFFETLTRLARENLPFKLIVLGEKYKNSPRIFKTIQSDLSDRILHCGYAEDFEEYARFLWKSHLLPVTSNQDFFGGSVVEAMYCNCYPILPKRLAFPEHIPTEFHDKYYYESETDFYQKLRQAILTFKVPTKPPVFQDFVSKYDWSTFAPRYDNVLEQII